MVGKRGFEPRASCSRSMRATKLRHFPILGTYGTSRLSRIDAFVNVACYTGSEAMVTPHPNLLPSRGEGKGAGAFTL